MQSIEIHIETLLRRHPELAPAAPAIRETIEMILAAFRAGNTLFCCGNGGSAADADHICGEFLKGFLLRRELPAAEQKHFTEKFGAEGSELAGKLQRGLRSVSLLSAKMMGIRTILLTGNRHGACEKYADVVIAVPDSETYRIQELHLPVYHTVCAAVEDAMFGGDER